jgi:hypothetical protein
MISVVRRFNEIQHICTAPPSADNLMGGAVSSIEKVQEAVVKSAFLTPSMRIGIAQVPPGGPKIGSTLASPKSVEQIMQNFRGMGAQQTI